MKYISIFCLVVLILISSVSCAVGTHADPQNIQQEETKEKEKVDDIESDIVISINEMNQKDV